jgi:hypothetical protein
MDRRKGKQKLGSNKHTTFDTGLQYLTTRPKNPLLKKLN